MTIGDRLKYLIEKLGITYKEFSKKVGIPYPTVLQYLSNKREPAPENLQKIAIHLNVNLNWLLTGEGEMFVKESPKEEDIFLKLSPEELMRRFPEIVPVQPVPVINQHVPAGFPEMPLDEEHIVDYIYVPNVPKGSMATKVKGDSMSPTIKDGEYIVFLPIDKTDVKSGDVVIVMNEWNELMVKRYRKKNGEVYLTSDNPEYPTVRPNEGYRLVAKVIKKVTVQNL